MESVLGDVTAVTSESIGAVVSVSPNLFEDKVLHHVKKCWVKKSMRKNKSIIAPIGNYILIQI